MNKSKLSLRNKVLAVAVLLVGFPLSSSWGANETDSGSLVKDLIASSGGGAQVQGSTGDTQDYSLGESAAGHTMSQSSWTLTSGYLAVRLGVGQPLSVVKSQIGNAPFFYQNGMQVGTTLQAAIQIDFSDQLDPISLSSGISVAMLQDHLGQPMNTNAPIRVKYNAACTRVLITPQPSWQGNTLYNVVLNMHLMSLNGYTLEISSNLPFVTALNPVEENVVSNRAYPSGLIANARVSSRVEGDSNVALDIPQGALSDFSMVLLNPDPLNNPLRVDPLIIKEATQKAQNSGGAYQTPVALGEISAYDIHGQPLAALALPAQATLSYNQNQGLLSGLPVPVRASTLSMWVLDQSHHLWVKIPASTTSPATGSVVAPVTQFSVFALMGGADGSTSDVNVFPNPWRPHGPNAGSGSGQTGTEAGGMTFNNLPSECTLRIYTLSQELVRTLHHSDAGGTLGQEIWDGKTSGGSHVASGVYLWRVESNVDAKNGKLMVIR